MTPVFSEVQHFFSESQAVFQVSCNVAEDGSYFSGSAT